MFKTLKSCVLVVLFLFVLRYTLGVLIYYSFPVNQWDSPTASFELANSPMVREDSPVYNVTNLWWRWDTSFYMSIAREGYASEASSDSYSNVAFFPLYPMLIRIFSFASNQPLFDFSIALILSNLFFSLALWILYKLVTKNLGLSENKATTVLFLLLAFPGSYFFNLAYTESLFLLLSVVTFYLMFNRRYFWAAIALGLTGITRLNGIVLLIPFSLYVLFKEYAQSACKAFLRSFCLSFLALVPLFLHFLYLFDHTGNFFASFEAQKSWNNFGFLPMGIFAHYLKIYGFSLRLEFVFSLILIFLLGLLLVITLVSFFKSAHLQEKFPESLSVFVVFLLNFLIISSVQNFSSIFRYVSVLFPVFLFMVVLSKQQFLEKILPFIYVTFISFQTVFYVMFLTNISAYGF